MAYVHTAEINVALWWESQARVTLREADQDTRPLHDLAKFSMNTLDAEQF